ncbi:MAG TPA: hypothetical protein VMD59_02180 [Acidimicrobiales bacterium]|nr:hypothetical protein [Acidimicrobiales bacterium]
MHSGRLLLPVASLAGFGLLAALPGAAVLGHGAPARTAPAATARTAPAAAVPASAAPAAATVLPKVVDCDKVQFEPSQYVLACADGNAYFKSLHWKSWTATGAEATGTFVENGCVPNCADGKFWSAPGTLVLSAPKASKLGPVFTKARYSYTRSFSAPLPTKPF